MILPRLRSARRAPCLGLLSAATGRSLASDARYVRGAGSVSRDEESKCEVDKQADKRWRGEVDKCEGSINDQEWMQGSSIEQNGSGDSIKDRNGPLQEQIKAHQI